MKGKGNVKILVLSHALRDLWVTHRVHLWLDGKLIVDFLLLIIEFLLALTAEALLNKSAFSEGVGHFARKFLHRWGRRRC